MILCAALLSGCATPPARTEYVRQTLDPAVLDCGPEPLPRPWETTTDAAEDYLRVVVWGRGCAARLECLRAMQEGGTCER